MKRLIVFAAVAALMFMGCSKDKGTTGSIVVNLTDAPAPYQQVNVDIVSVDVHVVPSSGQSQWVSLPTKSGVFDLLALQNGIDTNIVNTTSLPTGKITQMRLILGSNNTVMDNGTIYPLVVPSGSETGIKIPGPIQITANSTVTILLDFDANKSVVQQGNNDYQLKPVIQVL